MKLYLTQHGEAEPKEINPSRPLSQKGVEEIEEMANFLNQTNVRVNKVVHSGKLRARQTAELLSLKIASESILEISDIINPNNDPEQWLNQIHNNDDILLVGHLPFMAKLVSSLLKHEKPVVNYQPGSMVCLESNIDGGWGINWMIRPELLK